MRALVAGIVASALVASGCGRSGATMPEPPRPPEAAADRAAANVVRAYDRAIRRQDPAAVCRVVGGAELDEFSCQTVPSIPSDRKTVLTDPAALGVHKDESRQGSIVLSGATDGTDMGLHFTVSSARGDLRVTHVRLGYAF